MKEKLSKAISMINESLSTDYEGYKLIYLSHSGSFLHGTSTPNSDMDLKGIFVPSLEAIIKETYPDIIQIKTNEEDIKNSSDDIDIELFSIKTFLNLIGRGELNCIELMFSMDSEFEIFSTEASKIIKENRKFLILNKTLSFVGFAMKQAATYSVKGARVAELEKALEFFEKRGENLSKKEAKSKKLKEFFNEFKEFSKEMRFVEIEEREEGIYFVILNRLHNIENTIGHTIKLLSGTLNNYGARAQKAKNANGADYKAMAHAIRALDEAIELLTTKNINFPLERADFLKSIKLGGKSVEEVSNEMEIKYSELEKASQTSDLLETLNESLKNNLNFNITKKTLKL